MQHPVTTPNGVAGFFLCYVVGVIATMAICSRDRASQRLRARAVPASLNQEKHAMFKLLLAGAAIAAISIAPAEARHVKRHQHTSVTSGAHNGPDPHGTYSSRLAFPGDYAHYGPDPYGVYVGGQKVGRDPDPNVRQRMLLDYDYLYSW